MFIPILTLSGASFVASILFARRASQMIEGSRTQSNGVILDGTDRIFIPILGSQGSGKTLLMATLGEVLSTQSSGKITTRFLSHDEEEKLRGRTLKQPGPGEKQGTPSLPGERSSQTIIREVREQFEKGVVVDRVNQEEDLLLSVHYATAGVLAGQKVVIWKDVPSEQWASERSHEANINPKIKQADALILTVDAEQLLDHQVQRSDYTIYHQVLERYLAEHQPGEIWVVMTKADRVKSSSHEDEAGWRTELMDRVTPLLKLQDADVNVRTSFVSLNKDSGILWQKLVEDSSEFLLSLKDILLRRHSQRLTMRKQRKRNGINALLSTILGLLFAWIAVGTYHFEHLPSVSGERSWDLASLDVASKPRLTMFMSSRHRLSSLSLYRSTLTYELSTLRHAYWSLVRDQADLWASQLLSSEDKLTTSRALLEQSLKHAQRINDQLAKEIPWHEDERALMELVHMAMKEVDETSEIVQLNLLLEMRQRWDNRCETALRIHSADQQKPFECSVKLALQKRLRTYRLAQLNEAKISVGLAGTSIQLKKRLEPLLAWQERNADLLSSDPLIRSLKQHKIEAWQSSWSHLNQLISQSQLPSEVRSHLKLLQRFELDRRELEERYEGNLEMPTAISLAWRDQLNLACTQLKRSSKSLTSSAQREVDGLIEWAAPLLDPMRRARVRLISREERWKTELKRSLNRSTSQRFDELLTTITTELTELEGEEGRREIREELDQWQLKLAELKQWRATKDVTLITSEIRCDLDALASEGLNHGAGSWDRYGLDIFDGDQMSFYLVLTVSEIDKEGDEVKSESKVSSALTVIDGEVSVEDQVKIKWRPWSQIKFKLFEQDGKKDYLSKSADGETAESDDHLISDRGVWAVGGEPPKGTIKLTPKGACLIDVELVHGLGAWVNELEQTPSSSQESQ